MFVKKPHKSEVDQGLVIIINGFQPLTIITKHSIFDVSAALDPPLINCSCTILYSTFNISGGRETGR